MQTKNRANGAIRAMVGGALTTILLSIASIAAAQPSGQVPLYRYFSTATGDHFYTTQYGDLGGGGGGWIYEGVTAYVFPTQLAGTVPLYRYLNHTNGDHFYTTAWSELGGGGGPWAYEGVAAYVFPTQQPGTVALHRYLNRSNGDHMYTSSLDELGTGNATWSYEGVTAYVTPPAAAPKREVRGPLDYNYSSLTKQVSFSFDCGPGWHSVRCYPVTVQQGAEGSIGIARYDHGVRQGTCTVSYPPLRSSGAPAAGGYGVAVCRADGT